MLGSFEATLLCTILATSPTLTNINIVKIKLRCEENCEEQSIFRTLEYNDVKIAVM